MRQLARHHRYLLFLLLFSAAARLVYRAVWGIRFNSEPITYYLQFLDPALLKNDLLRSVFYLRDQPPLYNFFLGLVLKLFPESYAAAFAWLHFAASMVLLSSMFLLMVRLAVSPLLSAIITGIFINSPIAILYENWLFYTLPLTAILAASALFLHRYLAERRTRDLSIFFFLMVTLVLARSIFHPLWMLVVLATLLVIERGHRRQVLLAALVPCLLVLALFVRNVVVFHSLINGRPLQQINLSVLSAQRLPPDLRNRLIREGKLTPAANMPYISGAPAFRRYIPPWKPTGIPALDQEFKSGGWVNINHSAYVDIGNLYGSDGNYAIRHYPQYYLEALVENVGHYALPSDQCDPFETRRYKNARALDGMMRPYNLLFAGQWRNRSVPWLHWIAFPGLLIFAALILLRALRQRRLWTSPAELTVLYLFYNILSVSLVTIIFSYGPDHNRYRFKVSPFYCVLLALALSAAIRWISARRNKTGSS